MTTERREIIEGNRCPYCGTKCTVPGSPLPDPALMKEGAIHTHSPDEKYVMRDGQWWRLAPGSPTPEERAKAMIDAVDDCQPHLCPGPPDCNHDDYNGPSEASIAAAIRSAVAEERGRACRWVSWAEENGPQPTGDEYDDARAGILAGREPPDAEVR